MNKNTYFEKPDTRDIDQLRSLDYARIQPDVDQATQIRRQARMHHIMAEPIQVPQPTRYGVRARRSVIAILTTLALGLGGATAATAVGLDNPIGDWIASFFTDAPVPDYQSCTVGLTAFRDATFEDRYRYGVSSPELRQAADILAGVDLSEFGALVRETDSLTTEERDAIVLEAINVEFRNRLQAAGLNPDEFMAGPLMFCHN